MSLYTSVPNFLWRNVRPYKWHYLLMCLAPLYLGLGDLVYQYGSSMIMKISSIPKDIRLTFMLKIFSILVFNELFIHMLFRLANWMGMLAEPPVRASILTESYDKLQHYPYAFFQKKHSSALLGKIKALLLGFDSFWEEMKGGLSVKGMRCLVSFLALFFIHPFLGVLMGIWILFFVWIMGRSMNTPSFRQLMRKENQGQSHTLGQIGDVFSNMPTVFAFHNQAKEEEHISTTIDKHIIATRTATYKHIAKISIKGSCLYLAGWIPATLCIVYLKQKGLIDLVAFNLSFRLIWILFGELWYTLHVWFKLRRYMRSLSYALEVFQLPSEREGQTYAPVGEQQITLPSITCENMSFTYDGREKLFSGLNLNIKAGEKIGLVGHSGVGKSTLFSLFLGYFSPCQGRILIGGKDISTFDPIVLRKQIALIPQNTILFHRSIEENLRYGAPNATQKELEEVCKKVQLHDLITQLPQGYKTDVGERGELLSGGQRQRLVIARAMLKKAPILLLDEATAALDSYTERRIQKGLKPLLQDPKHTLVVIAHRLSTIKDLKRLVVLGKEGILETGTHDELIAKKGYYKTLWDQQIIGQQDEDAAMLAVNQPSSHS